jgi:hypothetical protein
MPATPEQGYAEIRTLDRFNQQANWVIFIPSADFTTGDAITNIQSLIDVVRATTQPISTGKVVQIVIAQDYTVTDGSLTTPDADATTVFERGVFLYKGQKKGKYSIPSFKRSLLSYNPTDAKNTLITHDGPVGMLKNAWTGGLGGVAPVDSKDNPITEVSQGTLRMVGET